MIVIIFTHYLHTFLVLFTFGHTTVRPSASISNAPRLRATPCEVPKPQLCSPLTSARTRPRHSTISTPSLKPRVKLHLGGLGLGAWGRLASIDSSSILSWLIFSISTLDSLSPALAFAWANCYVNFLRGFFRNLSANQIKNIIWNWVLQTSSYIRLLRLLFKAFE